ncbi:MAG: daunorubicin/doxorubicin resistance ABC transporter ATP-binding protein DrrA, partial [Acidimicrobiia bacterium]|nr:daunorubicin/doxorubicin resistance ABC transporter ATP-binding protein DrrA [Acidimicrobiia bacterium]
EAAALLARLGQDEPVIDQQRRMVSVAVDPAVKVPEIVRAFDSSGIGVDDVMRRSSTLDDVFLTLTGAPAVERDPEEVAA